MSPVQIPGSEPTAQDYSTLLKRIWIKEIIISACDQYGCHLQADSPRLRPSTPKRPHPAPAPALPSQASPPAAAEVNIKPPATLPPIRMRPGRETPFNHSSVVRTLSPMRDPRPAAVRAAQPASPPPAPIVAGPADAIAVQTLAAPSFPAQPRAAQAFLARAPAAPAPFPAQAPAALAPIPAQAPAASAGPVPVQTPLASPATRAPAVSRAPVREAGAAPVQPAAASAAPPQASAAAAVAAAAPIVLAAPVAAAPVQQHQSSVSGQQAIRLAPPQQPQQKQQPEQAPVKTPSPAPVQEAHAAPAAAANPAAPKIPAAAANPPTAINIPAAALVVAPPKPSVAAQEPRQAVAEKPAAVKKSASSAWLQFADLEVPSPQPPKLELGGFVQPASPNKGPSAFPWSMSEPPTRSPSPQPATRPSPR